MWEGGTQTQRKAHGPVQEWTKAHSCANLDLTHGLSSRREDIRTTLIQTKHMNRGPRRGNWRTHHLRSKCTLGMPQWASCTKKLSTMEDIRDMQTKKRWNIWEGSHCLHIECTVPTELAAFMRKRHLNSSSTAHNTLYHL